MRTRSRLTVLLAIGLAMLMVPFAAFAKERPLKGKFDQAAVIWAVSHFAELACTSGVSSVAGAASIASGRISQLGDITSYVDAAWDWSVPVVSPEFTPVGPTTVFSATVLPATGSLPHTFAFDPFGFVCGTTVTATGQVIIVDANGDLVSGQVTGGEVYELDFDSPGDGQESFIKVDITGGTGRFSGATGSFVTHTIFDFRTGAPVVVSSELNGTIEY